MRLMVVILLSVLIACQSQDETIVLPTLVRFPTVTTASTSVTSVQATITATPSPTTTSSPTISPTAVPTQTITPTDAIQAIQTIPPLPTRNATPLPETFSFGQSAGGMPLMGYRLGTGSQIIILVGGIHTGFEANTVDLVERLYAYYRTHPNEIAPAISMIFVPTLNPDGIVYGRNIRGRFNGNGVDLNRNWGCGWSATAVFRDEPVNAGAMAFSEPEATALGSLIQQTSPAIVLFYHAAANGIFTGECGENSVISQTLAQVYGDASGYPIQEDFTDYQVTGSAPAWVASLGIPSLDVELASADLPETDRNLRAVNAVQAWLASR